MIRLEQGGVDKGEVEEKRREERFTEWRRKNNVLEEGQNCGKNISFLLLTNLRVKFTSHLSTQTQSGQVSWVRIESQRNRNFIPWLTYH